MNVSDQSSPSTTEVIMTETPEPTLASLMAFIGARYRFSGENYPNADLSTPEKVLAFAVLHSLKHISKSAGAIATETEAQDHGGVMDEENLRIATAKMLVNTLKLAEELGMSPGELGAMVPKVMASA